MDTPAIFGLQPVLSLNVYALIAKWYVTPWLAEKPIRQALISRPVGWPKRTSFDLEKGIGGSTHCNTVENPAAVFLCQYELPTFLGTVVMDAMKTHPICIVSSAIHQNQYYEKPEVYLEGLRRRDPTALA